MLTRENKSHERYLLPWSCESRWCWSERCWNSSSTACLQEQQ